MCGICGILNLNKDKIIDKQKFENMTDRMFHRGPDSRGIYVEANIGLGVRRLSIIDVLGGDQPIENEDGSLIIIFNGEIYNYKFLKRDLESKGHRFTTKTDTEVIIHSFEEYGPKCLDSFRGMFAFAIWDKNKKELFIVRDRLGIKPIYYFMDNERFIFASEIKAILATGYVSKEINLEAVDEYLSLRYIIEPNTIFKDIFILPAGHYMRFKGGKFSIERYWDLGFIREEITYNEIDCIEKTKELLEESIKLHLISDVPVGAYLSGGIDSSSIVSLMQRQVSEPIKTFSVGYPSGAEIYSELKFARIVSDYLNTEHHEILMDVDNFIHLIQKYIWYQEQPLADASLIPYYFISEYANRYVKVMLSGVGGDEFFYGYPELHLARINAQINRSLLINHRFKEKVINLYQNGKISPGRLRGLMRILFFPLHSYILIRYFEPRHKREIYSEDFLKIVGLDHTDSVIERLLLQAPKDCTPYQKVLYLYVKTWLATNMLQGTDKVTMASSIEQRVPLLDHKLIEFLSNVPYKFLIRYGCYKYLFKRTMEGLLPKIILKRKKFGFQIPEVNWYMKLKEEIESKLLSKNSLNRGYFNPQGIREILNRFNENRLGDLRRVWLLYNLEIWHRTFIDGDI